MNVFILLYIWNQHSIENNYALIKKRRKENGVDVGKSEVLLEHRLQVRKDVMTDPEEKMSRWH